VLADTRRSLRALETSHPPSYYIPFADVDMSRLSESRAGGWCEFKGTAVYWDGEQAEAIGWSYPEPSGGFHALRGHIAFYPARVEQCTVDSERVEAPARRLLRRRGHLARHRAVQGRGGHERLVARGGQRRGGRREQRTGRMLGVEAPRDPGGASEPCRVLTHGRSGWPAPQRTSRAVR
jgi:uncharacterized protein (DUF427 family)